MKTNNTWYDASRWKDRKIEIPVSRALSSILFTTASDLSGAVVNTVDAIATNNALNPVSRCLLPLGKPLPSLTPNVGRPTFSTDILPSGKHWSYPGRDGTRGREFFNTAGKNIKDGKSKRTAGRNSQKTLFSTSSTALGIVANNALIQQAYTNPVSRCLLPLGNPMPSLTPNVGRPTFSTDILPSGKHWSYPGRDGTRGREFFSHYHYIVMIDTRKPACLLSF